VIEVEWKFRIADLDELLLRLVAAGGVCQGESIQHDVYFSHPVRDYSQTDEAIRVRVESGRASLCYKGPRLDAASLSRQELELELVGGNPAGDRARELLTQLGFREVLAVHKRRSLWTIPTEDGPATAAVDDVAGLGMYVELEDFAEPDAWEAVCSRLRRLARSLGLQAAECRSYLELLLETGAGRPPDMTGRPLRSGNPNRTDDAS
jgi:adenylate cyclase class 2